MTSRQEIPSFSPVSTKSPKMYFLVLTWHFDNFHTKHGSIRLFPICHGKYSFKLSESRVFVRVILLLDTDRWCYSRRLQSHAHAQFTQLRSRQNCRLLWFRRM